MKVFWFFNGRLHRKTSNEHTIDGNMVDISTRIAMNTKIMITIIEHIINLSVAKFRD